MVLLPLLEGDNRDHNRHGDGNGHGHLDPTDRVPPSYSSRVAVQDHLELFRPVRVGEEPHGYEDMLK